MRNHIAHVRASDGKCQPLETHLDEVGDKSGNFAQKIGLAHSGKANGMVHDFGKYTDEFQNYLASATGRLNPDEDEYVDAKDKKGKVDHSTAGAQLVWRELSKQGPLGQIAGQILALCVASHHSGLIDCLTSDPTHPVEDRFTRRMAKSEDKAHLEEAVVASDAEMLRKLKDMLASPDLLAEVRSAVGKIQQNAPGKNDKSVVAQFQIGLLTRFLFSCLVDADRLNSADFEKPHLALHRQGGQYEAWEKLASRLEKKMEEFSSDEKCGEIGNIRKDISDHCLAAAGRKKGIYTLTVPTGGGKTLASLRFALHHAKTHGMDRVIYVIPFTSIIDQNADVVRKILEPESERGEIVLENHSNIAPSDKDRWREGLLAENWDAPVIYTTSVQFLEALFGSGTRSVRRMHQLANTVIVFDEIQTLPVKCVHLFNNAINFLVEQCGSTVVLCTATQPLLADVDALSGAARISQDAEIMPDAKQLFENLKRVEVKDCRRPGGWAIADIANLALKQKQSVGSCLVIVNTKAMARQVFQALGDNGDESLYHLSTSMCPAHRRKILTEIRGKLLLKKPVLCVSTQLIEAGVDVDFGSVIRSLAGLDSIAQAAGRCNRHGARDIGFVHVVNPADENLNHLEDIRIGREKAERVFEDFKEKPEEFDHDIIGLKAMAWYYKNYFFDRKDEMGYPVGPDKIGRSDTLLNLLSTNTLAVSEYARCNRQAPSIYLRQSFMAANKAFQFIDAPTKGVVVPYGEAGRKMIADLCSESDIGAQAKLLRQAQQFTVNIFPYEYDALIRQKALIELPGDLGIRYLNERYYSDQFGLSTETTREMDVLNV